MAGFSLRCSCDTAFFTGGGGGGRGWGGGGGGGGGMRTYSRRKTPTNVKTQPEEAHHHRIKKDHSAACFYCPDNDEATGHFLLHCPPYNNIRTRLLPPYPTLDNTLYGPTTQQQKTASFYITVRSLRDQTR